MKNKGIFFLIIGLFLFTNFSFAETGANREAISKELEQKTKPASKEDVVGEWEMAWQLNPGQIPSDDLFVAPYHKFYFSDNNGMAILGSDKPFDEIAATTWKWAKDNLQLTYDFVNPGVVLIKSGNNPPYYIVVSLVVEDLSGSTRPDAPKLKKGDLILSYPNQQGIYLIRYLSRILGT